jgi:hypothetical protein
MLRKLSLITLLILLSTGMAYADHKQKHDRVVVHDHRHKGGGGPRVRDHRSGPRVKHVRVNKGRYVFPGGHVRVYKQPKFHKRYRNRAVRPAIIVEHYDPVPGYVWVRGDWTWGGGEWVWTPGYWAVASEPVYVQPYAPPTVSGGVTVSGGITIR